MQKVQAPNKNEVNGLGTENSAVISHILISSRQKPQPGRQVFKTSWTPFKDAAGTFFQCWGTHPWNPLTQHYSGRKLPLCSCE